MPVRPAEYLDRLKSCLGYRIEGPYVIIENECRESIELVAVEVKYYITIQRQEEVGHGRREITERINVNRKLGPGGILDIYFGPVENLSTVNAIVRYGGGEYRVELRPRAAHREEEGESKG